MKKWLINKVSSFIIMAIIIILVAVFASLVEKYDLVDHTEPDKYYDGSYDPTLEIGQEFGGR